MAFPDATPQELEQAVQTSRLAFLAYKNTSLRDRAAFLHAIAEKLEQQSAPMVAAAQEETNLDAGRLRGELTRTIFQMNSYGNACAAGTWLDVRIDTGDAGRTPPKPDLRKMLVPLGPVVVFGASNFPFAYSTAGGDTACAFAAGCPVILKAHAAHAKTSQLAAQAIWAAAEACDLPKAVFAHLHSHGFEVGEALVQHPLVKAVGFTGSFAGGKALFDLANARPEPIPVFAEMGSINPVFLLPQKLAADTAALAQQIAASITLSAGQFCTNPGLLVAIESASLNAFKNELGRLITATKPVKMLHTGIAKNFTENREKLLSARAVQVLGEAAGEVQEDESDPTLAEVAAADFLADKELHREVFGPFSLLVVCKDAAPMRAVAARLDGQLTATIIATAQELTAHTELVTAVEERCGRLIFNGVPTGVEPVLAMQHGGPFPATTDSRFTSVGADGIRRFARPFSFQNWPDEALPKELQNGNPLRIWRTVNNQLTKEAIAAIG